MQLLGGFVFTVNKSLAKKLIVFPTVFLPSRNKKEHTGVITGCPANDVLVTQSVIHGPVVLGQLGGFVFSFEEMQTPRPLARPAESESVLIRHQGSVCTVNFEARWSRL